MEHHAQYKLEEMKQLRSLIVAYVQEIAKLELYAITSFAAIIYFNYFYSGTSAVVQNGIRFGPAVLSSVILFKAFTFAMRIYVIDQFLSGLEKEFVSKGSWIQFFYDHYNKKMGYRRWMIVPERLIITIVFFIVSLIWIWISPKEFRVSVPSAWL